VWLGGGQAVAASGYLLIAFFPVIGFFILWGTIRAIGWVGAVFFSRRSKQSIRYNPLT
jgi:hypothetical protein